MTKLNCTVKNCMYNKEKLCNLGNIKVEGTTAEVSDSTACASFRERDKNCCSNMEDKSPNKNSVVECMAQMCVYNKNCNCTATHIDVAGETANNYRETRCATFTSKDEK